MSKDSNNQLTVENLSVFRSELPLFEPVSLELKSGEAIQISGTNGSGKTSLLRCICGLSHRYEGAVGWRSSHSNIDMIADTNHDIDNSEFYRQLLYIGHSLGLKPKLTVLQNLDFYRQLRFTENSELIKESLDQLHIGAYQDELVGNLSAGQKRRVALARIICEPVALWILDEPMVALDAGGQNWLEGVCNGHLSGDGMILLTSHQTITGINGLNEYRLKEAKLSDSYAIDENVA